MIYAHLIPGVDNGGLLIGVILAVIAVIAIAGPKQ